MFQRQDTWTNQISHLARLGAPEAAPPTGTGGRGTAPLTQINPTLEFRLGGEHWCDKSMRVWSQDKPRLTIV